MILRYPGGKSRKSVLNKIKARFPHIIGDYREPFCGSAAVYFSLDPSIPRWINDKDADLMSVYLALRDHPEYFMAKCREILPPQKNELLVPAREDSEHKKSKKKALYSARLKNKFDELLNDPNAYQALKYFFINRTVWGGRVRYDIPSRLYFSNPNGWNIVNTDKLEKAASVLQNTIITSADYEDLIAEGGEDVFVYVDPPYYVNTLLSKTSQLYRHNFTVEDHEKLADCLTLRNGHHHKILISYDDCDFIRSLYKRWDIQEVEWTYCGTSSAEDAVVKTKKKGKELLITNY